MATYEITLEFENCFESFETKKHKGSYKSVKRLSFLWWRFIYPHKVYKFNRPYRA